MRQAARSWFKLAWQTRDLFIDFARYCHPEDFDPIFSEAEAMAAMAESIERFDATYPKRIPITHRLVPDIYENDAWDRSAEPWDEIGQMSTYYALFGHDRVVGLVDDFWFEQQNYATAGSDAGGASNGKLAPHFEIAERSGQNHWGAAHEVGHTFDLSAQPCNCVVELGNCWDEYEEDCFLGEPFWGHGFSMGVANERAGAPRSPDRFELRRRAEILSCDGARVW